MLYFDTNFGRIDIRYDFRLSRKIRFKNKISKDKYYGDILEKNGVGIFKEKYNEEFRDKLATYFSKAYLYGLISGLIFISMIISFFIGITIFLPIIFSIILSLVFALFSHINYYWAVEYNIFYMFISFDSYIDFLEKVKTGEKKSENYNWKIIVGDIYQKYCVLLENRTIVLWFEDIQRKKRLRKKEKSQKIGI